MKGRFETKKMVQAALFAALVAVLAQIQIPIKPIPFNLAVLGVYLAGVMLTPGWAVASAVLYILLGAVGIPVFAGFGAGPAVLLGPTGGYIVGYVFLALAVSLAIHMRGSRLWMHLLGMAVGLALLYAFGTAWYVILSGKGLAAAIQFCVLPFILPDMGKGALAYAAGRMLNTRLAKAHLL